MSAKDSFASLLVCVVFAVVLSLSPATSGAQVTDVQGTLNIIPGTPATFGGSATEVDYYYFTVNTPGVITIDTLSWLWDSDSDGTAHFIDPSIHLYIDDGVLDAIDLVASNDDGPQGTDGSDNTYGNGTSYDSYLSVALAAGDYVLALSDTSFIEPDAHAGVNPGSLTPVVTQGAIIELDFSGCSLDCSFGDYQVRFNGDVTLTDGQTPNPAGDYNGDGKSDILWRYTPTGAVWIYLMDGNSVTASLFVSTVADSNWKVVGNGDYNGDGKADILWWHQTLGTVWQYLMDSNSITLSSGVGVVPNTNWKIIGSGDYDGNGKSDILWRNVASGTNWMYLMDGAAITTSVGVSTTADLNWNIVGNGDYDGDGKSDILWRNASSGTNWMYLMNGTSIATSSSISVLPDTNWTVVGDGDYNGDQKADVLWRNLSTGSNFMYLMNGLTITDNDSVSTVADQNWQVVDTN